MAKRSTKLRQTQGVLNVQEFQRDDRRQRNLQVLEGGYQPANDANRDHSFVKNVRPKSKGQSALMEAIDTHAMVLALGPAGTGKTYLAITKAVEALESGKVGRIVLSRPAVEAGESLPAPALRRAPRSPLAEASQSADGGRTDRDRAGWLHAWPHLEQRVCRDR